MAGVYLGESGMVELRRHSENVVAGLLTPEDVNTAKRRFSFAFDPSALVSGDRIEITRTDGGVLELVSGHGFPDGQWFCHVDAVGSVRLFNSFVDAINGEEADALPLVAPTVAQPISVTLSNRNYRCLANITDWQLTTNRDAVDLTVLGEEHRRFYTNGLMSGQGSLRCFWNYEQALCDGNARGAVELPHYMAQLVLRCQLGAEFLGRFYIKTGERGSISTLNSQGYSDDHIWWECEAIVTNVGMSFQPGQPVRTSIDFITTGPVHLRMGRPPSFLLQEDGSLLLQEDGTAILLEDD
jgi:hypothetical protein